MMTKKISLKSCIEDLSSKNTDYKFPEQAINQAESLKSLSSDLYTDNIRFIYELIQNADDAQAINVTLTILDDKYLIIAHDGKAFDEKDLQGLCGVNNGTKKKDLDKTGYKGLGFKAVFGKSDYVIIYSNGEYFRFDSSYHIKWNTQWRTADQQTWERRNDRQFIYPWQINPVWTNQNEIPSLIRGFLNSSPNQIHVANIISLNNVEDIRLAIDQLKQQPYMFLFLRNISEMIFSAKSIDTISIARDSNYGLKKVYFNQKIVSQWIIKRFELDVPEEVRDKLSNDSKAPEKLRFIKKAEIFFAAKYKDRIIDENGKSIGGGIEKLHDQDSILFSYLPTKILEYKFPVLINGNFLTNANREQIHTDSAWNQWLFDKIGSEIFQWIKELVTDNKFRFQAYRLIPSRLNLANNILSKRFNESFEMAVKHYNFILNRTNQLCRVDEVIMDLTSLSEQPSFINTDSMRKYVIDYYKSSHFQCAEHPFIDYDSNLSRVHVRQFSWHNCIEMFNSDIFLQTHSIEQNKRMIEYFYLKCSKHNTAFEDEIHIEQIPFLMDQNNRLQMSKDTYFPAETIGDGETNDSHESFVNKLIFNWLNEYTQKEIKEWLQKLGVIERTDLTYLYKTIIPNAATYITLENAIQTIKMLFTLFQNNAIDKKELDQLKKLKLLTTRKTLVSGEQCFFSDQYKPRLSLEEYLKTKEDTFLSFDYVTSSIYKSENDDLAEWRRFFTMLGVQEELQTIEFKQKLVNYEATKYGFCHRYLSRKAPYERHAVDAYSGLKTITFLQYIEDNFEFAKFFWSYVIKNIKAEKLNQNTRVYWGYSDKQGATRGTAISDADYVDWFIKTIECVPTTLNTCEKSSNIFVETKEMKELCGKYMPFPSILFPQDKTEWHRILNFKTKLSVSDYLDLLEKIHHDEPNLKDNLNRIQMIYSYMLRDIVFWSSDERSKITARANSLYLLTENDQWKLASDLYIYMEGNGTNSNLNDAIPCVKLDFKNRTHSYLQNFLDLFNIKQIKMNDLMLIDKDSSHAEQFRTKLIEISPFLKKWLTTMSFPSDVISSIDKIIQQEIDFIESDCLELFYNEKFIQETNVYFDNNHQQLYVTRPWNGETTFIDLPNKLCQLLNIQGFESELRFLLKGTIIEITKHFNKHLIEIPTDTDTVVLEPLERSEILKRPRPLAELLPQSNESTFEIKNKETTSEESSNDSEDMETYVQNSENRKNVTGFSTGIKRRRKASTGRRQRHYYAISCSESTQLPVEEMSKSLNPLKRSLSSCSIESSGEGFENIQVIDISSSSKPMKSPFDGIGGNGGSDVHTGSIGERIVYEYLQKKYSSYTNSVSIQWQNQNGESHLPYDILLTENGIKNYIEVKSTRTNNQHSFQLSVNQIEAISEYKEHYSIYRIYLEENKLIIFDDIRHCLKHKQQLACFLTIKPQSLGQIISTDQ